MTSNFRTLDSADVAGKRVLVRVDLNVPMENGKVTDATRIERVAPTIREIADKGGKVILLAHFGRPKGRDPKESLKPVAAAVAHVHRPPVALRRRLHRRGRRSGGRRDEARRHPAAWRTPASTRKRRRTIRPSSRSSPRSATSTSTTPSRPRIARTPRPKGSRHKLPAYAGRTMQAELEALAQGARSAEAPGDRDRRRRQGLDQARSARTT